MKLLIVIPSKRHSEAIFKRTLKWVTRTGFDVRIFVEPQELEAYREAARNANYENYTSISDDMFIDIGRDNTDLGYAKGFMKRYAEENGYELVFKLDDDIKRFHGQGKVKPIDSMIIDFSVLVGHCRSAFGRYKDLAAISFDYGKEVQELKQWTAINPPLNSSYIIKTEYMQEGFSSTENFAQYLYIRSLDKVTLRYGLLAIDVANVDDRIGGWHKSNYLEKLEEELPRLKQIYPNLDPKPTEDNDWMLASVFDDPFFGVKKL